ncbi:exported protein of unknown function (plasmid) [Cupriavidus taiwanensis]|uniref:Uncharacterized protein n=1 Tax=Cupriavidus taiwanensis TaxID=164546 RepID=A0A375IR13_9BURK|nr:exported protein of unknown function [Cupriavidus taiwanensis]
MSPGSASPAVAAWAAPSAARVRSRAEARRAVLVMVVLRQFVEFVRRLCFVCVPFMYGTIGVNGPAMRGYCRMIYSKILNKRPRQCAPMP